jgi:hypothetical protein
MRLFISQLCYGPTATAGDLVITQLDFSGKQLGYMYLTGFGHGIAFGAQAEGSFTYLWTETDVDSSGYGKKIGRFKFPVVQHFQRHRRPSLCLHLLPLPHSTPALSTR